MTQRFSDYAVWYYFRTRRHRPSRDAQLILEEISELKKELNHMSERSDAILAKITKNTDALKSIGLAVDALNEGQTSIEKLIKDLKDQIAAGNEADFEPVEAALEEQSSVIEGLEPAITEGTDFEPSNQ